ncbi:MAG: hypothetical protein KBC95_02805, partial [Candidatus Peribacteraceae bacterium]|nr:hypothetical protein [Candidatus Peribacteraceae bacterium]
MNLALTADWLTTAGGAEHVIAELSALWPSAPIFTTVAAPERLPVLARADIRTTPLQRWYTLLGNHQLLLPLMPAAMEAIDLSLLTDGLQAEREQGITIDVAYRYFTTGTRKYIIADA